MGLNQAGKIFSEIWNVPNIFRATRQINPAFFVENHLKQWYKKPAASDIKTIRLGE
jgi:predicted metallopeptidase